jgi:A/G-specific adenine glycosylase
MPWRETKDPYRIWLSEVMLQQTQVDTVIPYYNRFVDRFPDLETLSKADPDEVLKYWEGLGYYRRCHHFIEAVRDVAENYSGVVPDDPQSFGRLKGVGGYTTAAVMSIAYGKSLPVMDGNVIRVITRFYRISGDAGKTATQKKILEYMTSLIPGDSPGDFNQAVMELGATVCTPRNPKCLECPLNEKCEAFLNGDVLEYPYIEKKTKVPEYRVGLGIIRVNGDGNGRFLIQKRPSEGHLAGLWELPGGRAEPWETPEDALKRKCREEIGLDVSIGEKLAEVRHVYSHFKISISVYACDRGNHIEKAVKGQPFSWITKKDLADYAFPSANHKLFKKIFK